MKPLRTRLQETRKRLGQPWEVIERDYVQSWIIAGINRVRDLHETLVFKGGTALRKCYFGEYRFSEDLDFTGLDGVPTDVGMESAIREACREAAVLLDEYAPVEITSERYTERDPHPAGQEAFIIRARFPWHSRPQTRVMVEITVDEPVMRPPRLREIRHEYGESMQLAVRVYALEEIIAEKMRAILQHIQLLDQRGWSRSRARDYYDLWRILNTFPDRLDLSSFPTFLRNKCAVRQVSFDTPEDFFQDILLIYVKKTWEQLLGPLVPELPSFDTVIGELRPQIATLLSGLR